MDPTKFLLAEKEIPSAWYIQADLPERLNPSRDLESEDRRPEDAPFTRGRSCWSSSKVPLRSSPPMLGRRQAA